MSQLTKEMYLSETKAIEFIWLIGIIIYFGYALLQKYKWGEVIHFQRNRYKIPEARSNNLPRNQFVIDEQGDIEEKENYKNNHSEGDIQIDKPTQQSIAQTIKPKIMTYLDLHLVIGSVGILCAITLSAHIVITIFLYLYFFAQIIITCKEITNKNVIILLPHICIIVIFITYFII
ncbi:hypothetical protein pb186bvf_015612 [Paramecium bursaria]